MKLQRKQSFERNSKEKNRERYDCETIQESRNNQAR